MATATAITLTNFRANSVTDLRTNTTDWSNAEVDRFVDEANKIIISKIKEVNENYFSTIITQYYLAYQQEYTLNTGIDRIIYAEDFSGAEMKPVRLNSGSSGYYFLGAKIGIKPIPTETYTSWSDGSPTYATSQTITLTGDYTKYFKSACKIKYYPNSTSTSKTETTLSTDSTFSTTTGLTTLTLTASDLESTFTGLEVQDGIVIYYDPNFSDLSGATDTPDFDAKWHFIIYDYLKSKYYQKFPTEGDYKDWENIFFQKIDDLILEGLDRDRFTRKIPISINNSGVSGVTN